MSKEAKTKKERKKEEEGRREDRRNLGGDKIPPPALIWTSNTYPSFREGKKDSK